VGEKMRQAGLFSHHVFPEHAFEDEFHFYRFNPAFDTVVGAKPPVVSAPMPAKGPVKVLDIPKKDQGRVSPQPPTSVTSPRPVQGTNAPVASDWLQNMRRPSIIRASAPKIVEDDGSSLVIVVFGASGDLAHKKTFPALFGALYSGHLDPETQIVGFARSKFDKLDDFKAKVTQSCKTPTPEAKALLETFKQKITYCDGQYDDPESFKRLNDFISKLEPENATAKNRIFYLALPPSVFTPVAKQLKEHCYAKEGWNRLVVEKPFGKDLESSNELAHAIGEYWREDEIYRIDHYLGKEMVKNIIVLRFTNRFIGGIWSREHIDNVQITFKENFGTEGRGGYFDEFGIIRDVMQNHLMQVLTLITMEKPVTFDAEDVRNEKVKVLKYIPPINWEDCMVGQYSASKDGKEPGYKDDATVPKDSVTPTWAIACLWVCNERWDGVPFIFKAGKALNESKAEIRVQFRDVAGNTLFPNLARNELVIRIQPDEAGKCLSRKEG
jgi:glucose-6-phosphate 1-dehydrogenase